MVRSTHNMLTAFIQLIRSWYSADRIRIPPTTGRLLQLKAGNSIILLDELYVVTERNVSSSGSAQEVAFQLKGLDGTGILRIRYDSCSRTQAIGQLTIADRSLDICDTDVSVVNAESGKPVLSLTSHPGSLSGYCSGSR